MIGPPRRSTLFPYTTLFRAPPPRGRGGVLRPRGQGEGLLRGRRRPPRGDSARTLGLRLRTGRRRPRLREHRARGRLDPGDARPRPPRPHVLRRSRAAGEARRAPRGDARVTVGVSVKRKEDARLLVGAGRYLDDLTAPGLLHLAVVRSPHPHARVLAVDRRAALAGAGTVAVLTVDDLPELAGSIPPLVPTPTIRSYAHAVLAGPVVRHAGEAVVVVVAEDRYRAADAAERVRVEYEVLPAATTPASALARGAPRVHPDWPDNLAGRNCVVVGDPDRGFAEAAVVVEGDFVYPRMTGVPIEARGVFAVVDPLSGVLNVWSSTQVPFAVRSAIARVLGLPEDRVRVRTPEVGGGFGVKGHAYPEDVLIPAVARAGRPEAALVLARLLDRAARALGMDPAELRRRNMIRPDEMPYRSGLSYRDGVPIAYDPADYVSGFDRLLGRLDYAGWRKRQRERRGSDRPLGVGLSVYVEGTGLGPFEGADVRVDPGGTVFVRVGVAAQGQAHETTLAQICAERLGVPLAHVVVLGGDTELVGFGMGTIASRVAAVAGPAVAKSADEVARRAQLVAAEQLECAPEDVVLAEGRASVRGVPDRGLPLGVVARAAVRSRALASRGSPGLSACGFFYPDSVTWAFGAHGAAVEVDVETGAVRLLAYAAVHDCGRAINPMVVEGQVHGGIAQGVGAGLQEELMYDDAGQLLTATLMDYALPRADQVPPLGVEHLEHASAVNALGIKGVGESGVIAPGAAIAGAVEDALAEYGVTVDRIPLTPARVFELLRSARRRHS